MTHASQLKPPDHRDDGEKFLSGEYVIMKSFDYHHADPGNVEWTAQTRYCDQPMDWRTRLVGIGGTSTVCAILLLGALITWTTVERVTLTSDRLVVMDLAPLAAPPEPVQDVAPGPQQVERQEAKPEPAPEPVIPEPIIRLPSPAVTTPEKPIQPAEPVDPGPPIPDTTAPKSIAAPIASRASNTSQPNWESQILAHLERFRRYPSRARAARQQGTVLVRFTMNRAGMVLAASIAKKSGSFDLDQSALETFRRAQPLPAIPPDRPDPVELTIPVEFYLR